MNLFKEIKFRKLPQLHISVSKLIYVIYLKIRFTRDAKSTTIEKTNDPGPATYARYDTVGVIPKHDRNEANARVV